MRPRLGPPLRSHAVAYRAAHPLPRVRGGGEGRHPILPPGRGGGHDRRRPRVARNGPPPSRRGPRQPDRLGGPRGPDARRLPRRRPPLSAPQAARCRGTRPCRRGRRLRLVRVRRNPRPPLGPGRHDLDPRNRAVQGRHAGRVRDRRAGAPAPPWRRRSPPAGLSRIHGRGSRSSERRRAAQGIARASRSAPQAAPQGIAGARGGAPARGCTPRPARTGGGAPRAGSPRG